MDSTDTRVREARGDEREIIFPLLLLAEPSASALRWSLRNLSDTAYVLELQGRVVGAATVRFRREPCEIVELGVAEELQGRGLGRLFVGRLIEEARRRRKREVFLGTRSTSAANIIFYQKCGFRVHGVRQDYFWYYDEPVYENGLLVRDMVVLRYDLAGDETNPGPPV
jgi:ribosomal protein S18 acetylase RimI-like enzyme